MRDYAGVTMGDLGRMIDSSEDTFEKKYIIGRNLSYLLSLKNLLSSTWENLRALKDGILERISKGALEDSEETKKVLTGLYEQMFNVERKASIVQSAVSVRVPKEPLKTDA